MRTLALVLLALAVAGCTGQNGATQEPPATTTTATTTSGSATTTTSTPPTVSSTPPTPPTAPSHSASVRQQNVTIADFAFSPVDITVVPGSTVTWTNDDETRHSIVVDGTNKTAGPIAQGDQAALTFPENGTYAYHCGLHPAMKGVVRVEALAPAPPPPAPPAGTFKVNISGHSYQPNVLRVSAGSVVNWTNLDFEPANVKSDAAGLFGSPILLQGDSYAVTFSTKGTYTYHCDFHQMSGTIIVE